MLGPNRAPAAIGALDILGANGAGGFEGGREVVRGKAAVRVQLGKVHLGEPEQLFGEGVDEGVKGIARGHPGSVPRRGRSGYSASPVRTMPSRLTRSSSAAAVSPKTGSGPSVTSASGTSTKPRSARSAWGTCRSGSSVRAGP